MRIASLLTLFVLCISAPLASGAVLVTSRAGLSGSDFLAISAFGTEGTSVASGTTVNTLNFNTVTITDSGTNGFSVLQQNSLWSGNFADGDQVLWTGNVNSPNGDADAVPVTFTFGSLVRGVGLQIQPSPFGAFTASIDAFDATNSNIGSFTETGLSSSADDNSAIFLGVLSTSANIKSITINITSPAGVDFAFNELSFEGAAASVPEPASMTLLLFGAGVLPVLARRRARQNHQHHQ
jgi:hypothetical protein